MPSILKVNNPGGLQAGVWEITETHAELEKLAGLNTEEKATHDSFKNESRQMQWLAVRALLNEIMGQRPVVAYKENGKPYFANLATHISISHAGKMAAVALHNTINPGIDIEIIHPKINKIASRFVNDTELSYLNQNTLTEQLCVIWAAKEVLYKTQLEGMISFKEHLSVGRFALTGYSEIKGTISRNGTTTHYKLVCQHINGYVLVYTV